MKSVQSIDQYIAAQPQPARRSLELVRSVIRKALPDAEEAISYNMPAYKLRGSAVLYFAGWKKHYSLYPASERMLAEFGDELAPYKVHKGTIRFPYTEPVPERLIARVARFRAEEESAGHKVRR